MNARIRRMGWGLALLLPAAIQTAGAQNLAAQDAWVRAAPPGAPVMAGFVTLHNGGVADQVVSGARSTAFGSIELHEMRMVDGVMRMRPLPSLTVPAGERVELAPGGKHLMLFAPGTDLAPGDRVAIELQLGDGSVLPVEFEVRAAGGAR